MPIKHKESLTQKKTAQPLWVCAVLENILLLVLDDRLLDVWRHYFVVVKLHSR